MIKTIMLWTSILSLPALAADSKNQQGFQQMEEKTWELFHGSATSNPHTNPHTAPMQETQDTSSYYGVVDKVEKSGGYVYILLETSDGPVWAATGLAEVKKGDKIRLDEAFPMHNFHAKSLNKTFDVILFAGSITKAP